MLIGLLLSASAIMLSGRVDPSAVRGELLLPAILPLLLPLAVIAVPLLDVGMAVVRRTRRGRSPFAPDKEHLHHRLIELGHSPPASRRPDARLDRTDRILGGRGRPDPVAAGAGRLPDRAGRAGVDGVATGSVAVAAVTRGGKARSPAVPSAVRGRAPSSPPTPPGRPYLTVTVEGHESRFPIPTRAALVRPAIATAVVGLLGVVWGLWSLEPPG